MPSLILQPLVENSIKYAVANRESGGKITINAEKHGNELLLRVADDGPGIPLEVGELPNFKGVGLVNTMERLEQLYGAKHSCEFKSAVPHGLVIEIQLPYETES